MRIRKGSRRGKRERKMRQGRCRSKMSDATTAVQ